MEGLANKPNVPSDEVQTSRAPQRILIIGCCGAGKSTFARQLAKATGLPLISLDRHYWQPEWRETPSAEWTRTVAELAARPRWIMDGNYGGTLDLRLARADTVIFLDYATSTCLWRVTKRTLRYHGRTRPDMAPGCRERFDLPFLRYVATYRRTRRPALLTKLDAASSDTAVYLPRNDWEARRVIDKLSA